MYQKLDPAKSEIRLLRLLPGASWDRVECEVSVASLDDANCRYEALSYVCGDPTDTRPIAIDGATIQVTKNLRIALQNLRNTQDARTLWVDAVSINQADISERNHQVRLMSRIYRSALLVVAWLGPEVLGMSRCAQAVERFGGDREAHWAKPEFDIAPDLFLAFLKKPWWTRVWTVQELVCAQSLVFQWGSLQISKATMGAMAQSYFAHVIFRKCCDSYTVDHWKDSPVACQELGQHLQEVGTIFNELVSEPNFFEVAAMFQNRQCTEPKDHVYGYFGISSGLSTVDYAMDLLQVYEQATLDVIRSNGDLSALGYVLPGHLLNRWLPGEDGSRPVPSWVPHYRGPADMAANTGKLLQMQYCTYGAVKTRMYKACGNFALNLGEKKTSSGFLAVEGIFCDFIEKVGVPRGELYNSSAEPVLDWRSLSCVDENPNKTYAAGLSVFDAFWRTVCMDISVDQEGPVKRAGREERQLHELWWRLLQKKSLTEMETEAAQAYDVHTKDMTRYHRFIVTRKRYFGMAMQDAQPGDAIFVLAGGKMPFALRLQGRNISEEALKSETKTIFCQLVGEAFVQGIMDGELVAERAKRDPNWRHINIF